MTKEPEVTEHESEKPPTAKRGGRRKATSRAATPESKPSPSPAPKQPVGKPQVRRVTLRNRRGQIFTPSVLNEHGEPVTIKLPAFGRVEVIEDRITQYTRDLAAQGHLSIDPPQ